MNNPEQDLRVYYRFMSNKPFSQLFEIFQEIKAGND